MKQGGASHDKLSLISGLCRGGTGGAHGRGNAGAEAGARAGGLAIVLGDKLVDVGNGGGGGVAQHIVLLDEFLALLFVIFVRNGAASRPDVLQSLGGGDEREDGRHVLDLFALDFVVVEAHGLALGRQIGEHRLGRGRPLRRRWVRRCGCGRGRRRGRALRHDGRLVIVRWRVVTRRHVGRWRRRFAPEMMRRWALLLGHGGGGDGGMDGCVDGDAGVLAMDGWTSE